VLATVSAAPPPGTPTLAVSTPTVSAFGAKVSQTASAPVAQEASAPATSFGTFVVNLPTSPAVNGLLATSIATTAEVPTTAAVGVTSYRPPAAMNALDALMSRWGSASNLGLAGDSWTVPASDALRGTPCEDLRDFGRPSEDFGLPANPLAVDAVMERLDSAWSADVVPVRAEVSPTLVDVLPAVGDRAIAQDEAPEQGRGLKRLVYALLWLLPALQIMGLRQRERERQEERPSLRQAGE
jgi:hypothetical protein